jgi:hypothetical protein
MTTDPRTPRSDEPLAIELTADPGLAMCVVEDPKGGGRTPLHLFADWP